MKFRITLFVELTISMFIVFLLAGCFGNGGSSSAYDGTWTAVFADAGTGLPPAASGATVSCTLPSPLPTITLVDGIGSTSQIDPCTGTAGGVDAIYLISVAITPSTGAVKAIVNGGTLTGQCISTRGCPATGTMGSLSLTR